MSSLLGQVVPMARRGHQSHDFLLQLNTLIGSRSLARGSTLTAGAAVVLIVLSTIGVALGDTGFSTNDQLPAVINIAFGVLLVAVGLRALLRPPTPKPSKEANRQGVVGSFLAGAAAMASNLTTFALYTPALALIAGSGLPSVSEASPQSSSS